MDTMRAQLLSLFRDLGFVDSAGRERALHANCGQASRCWGSVPQGCRPKADNRASMPYLAWVGSNYSTSRILVVGLNMNEAGGLEEYYERIPVAQKELLKRNRIRFENPISTYAGNLFETRMLMCVWALLRHLGLGPWRPGSLEEIYQARKATWNENRSRFAEGYDWIALTNTVKCGPLARDASKPKGPVLYPKGNPTPEMVTHCPSHVLRRELDVLRPRYIIAMGEDAFAAIGRSAPSGCVVVPTTHPAAHGYVDQEILRSFAVSVERLTS